MSRWTKKRKRFDYEKMAKALGISPVCACILANRGVSSYFEALDFLSCDMENIKSCEGMKDADAGTKIILNALKEKELIAIYGDYDVDGVMSTVILYKALKSLGGNAIYYIPDRHSEGYGLNIEAVDELNKNGVKVILACDNGISAFKEVDFAKELGMKIVIIDHHEPSFVFEAGMKKEIIPLADAVIDPKQEACPYGFSNFCAAGLSYKFAKGLFAKENKAFDETGEFLTYAAIATICDIVDVLDENRTIAKCGIENIKDTGNLGLDALIFESGLKDKKITEYHIGFVIGPAINATGRLKSATLAIGLFIEEDSEKCLEIARKLCDMNSSRKSMTLKAYDEALEIIKTNGYENHKVITVFSRDISESIAGIVAGRIKESFNKPAIVITSSDDFVKGSARSIETYNIFDALLPHKGMFYKFGGHAMAAGFLMDNSGVSALREALNIECCLCKEDFEPVFSIDCELKFKEITHAVANGIMLLAPFGKGNPVPLFGIKNLIASGIRFLGADRSVVKMTFTDSERTGSLNGVYFGGYENFIKILKENYGGLICDKVMAGGNVKLNMDMVFNIDINEFRGEESVQLIIKDFRKAVL
ncbi:MAG: single-stranded-DNA-specific exonuclease RecJ [Lachnospiraceae bacterium]|nr:single-stranded-DNA-specific exonuclease RecJ [Lachnospiraceae bacterium]